MKMRANLSRPFNRRAKGEHFGGYFLGETGGSRRNAVYQIASELSDVRQGGSSPDVAKVEAASIAFGTSLHNRINRPGPLYPLFALLLRTNKLLTREIWLDNIPKMRLWQGDKVLSMLRAETLPIVTRPHEASMVIPKGDILNDDLGLYQSRINQMGDAYVRHLDEMFLGMLIGGLQGVVLGTTYDGQNLIDTDHTYLGNGTGPQYSNKVTGAFSATTYAQAWNLFLSMKDENGHPLSPVATGRNMYLLHGPANRVAVRNVLGQEQIIGGTATNLDKGTAIPYCTSWITAGAVLDVLGQKITLTGLEWFLIPEGSSAIMLQIKRDVEFLAVDRGDDEFTFRTGKLLYGIESEDGAAYGLPQEIVGGTGA